MDHEDEQDHGADEGNEDEEVERTGPVRVMQPTPGDAEAGQQDSQRPDGGESGEEVVPGALRKGPGCLVDEPASEDQGEHGESDGDGSHYPWFGPFLNTRTLAQGRVPPGRARRRSSARRTTAYFRCAGRYRGNMTELTVK